MDVGERVDATLDWLDRFDSVWAGTAVGAALGAGTALVADLPVVPLAVVAGVAGAVTLWVGHRADEGDGV